MGFPRFQKESRSPASACFTTGTIRVDDKSHAALPQIGRVGRTSRSRFALFGSAPFLRKWRASRGLLGFGTPWSGWTPVSGIWR